MFNGSFFRKSYSQLNQDIEIINRYKKRNGYFVEIGANDGKTLSNTYLLEKTYGWRGICVEPIPDKFRTLQEMRTNSICFERAVYSQSDLSLKFMISNESSLLSGLTDNIDKHSITGNTINVKTITLTDALDQANAPKFIEYLSLDTEGSELEILKSFDFSKYTFGIIHVEHNYVEPRRTDMRNVLLSNGYLFLKENKWDDEYIHKSII